MEWWAWLTAMVALGSAAAVLAWTWRRSRKVDTPTTGGGDTVRTVEAREPDPPQPATRTRTGGW